MKWVLVLVFMTAGGVHSQQAGPYSSEENCLLALTTVEVKHSETVIGAGTHSTRAFCIPGPAND